MFAEDFERKLNSLNWLRGHPSNNSFVVFWARKTKREKLPRNHTKSATELSEVMMSDVTENSLLTLTAQFLSLDPTSRY
jgi:hypothetical protein